MLYKLENKLVIGISSRALFDQTLENEIFRKEGLEAYRAYQIAHEREVMKPGPGFGLVRALLELNGQEEKEKRVEIIIMSHNNPDISLRIFHSIAFYGLAITRAVLVSGAGLAPYLKAFGADLFLSASREEVQSAIDSGIAAGIICTGGSGQKEKASYPIEETSRIRIAFDADAVLFTDESERIYKQKGLHAFEENERLYAQVPLAEGPFAGFLQKLSLLKEESRMADQKIRTALVTSRCAPAHERVLRTLRAWNVKIDEAFFLGGIDKREVLQAFGAQIFFDDQTVHTDSAAKVVPAALVPYSAKDCAV